MPTTPSKWLRCSPTTTTVLSRCTRDAPSRGRAQVLENWTAVFEGVPDFVSRLVSSSIDGDNEWGEWDWRGRHVDGSPFLMRGVTILIIRDGLIAAARLYVEPVEDAGEDIDTAVRELYKPPSADESGSSVDDSQADSTHGA